MPLLTQLCNTFFSTEYYCTIRRNCSACATGLCFQSVIDANIIPALIDVMGRAEFKTRKEAAWAITNAVSGGSADQIRFLVDQGCIPPLCNLLTVMDGKIVQVALNGLEHILRAGLQESKLHGGMNLYAVAIEECYGMKLCTNC